jgi:hypothetical protein
MKWRNRFATIAFALLAESCGRTGLSIDDAYPASPAKRGGPWRQFGANARQNCRSSSTVGDAPAVVWSVDASGPRYITWQTPVVDQDGNVYVTLGQNIRSFDGDGHLRWRYDVPQPCLHSDCGDISGASIAVDGSLLVSEGKSVKRLSAAGQVTGVFATQVGSLWLVPPTVSENGTIYVAGVSTVYALSPQLDLEWSSDLPSGVPQFLAEGPDGALYVVSIDKAGTSTNVVPSLTRFFRGTRSWTVTMTSATSTWGGLSGIALGDDTTLWLTNHAVDADDVTVYSSDGSERFSRRVLAVVATSPAVDTAGRAYVTHDSGVTAYSPAGDVLWQTSGSVWATPALSADGTLVIVDGIGIGGAGISAAVSVRGVRDGTDRWHVDLESPPSFDAGLAGAVVGSVAIGPDGTIFASTLSRLYALR